MSKVLLTGSTGNLGTYLLDSLLQSQKVDQIWCLNRSPGVANRQPQLLRERGLSDNIPTYVEFYQSDTSEPDLGLDLEVYEAIAQSVTHILHAAWPVDWNKSFTSFTESIRGVRHMVDLAIASPHSPLLFYVSSVAAVGNWGIVPGARETVPEEEIEDWKVARMGYGQSKLVSERLLASATRSSGITTAICRVGQVAGPVEHGTNGAWPQQEWLPSLIASSKHLGCLPKTLGPAEILEWVPVDQLSTIMVEMLLGPQPAGTVRFHHVTNPRTVPWQVVLPAVKQALESQGTGSPLAITDLSNWVDALEHSSDADASELSRNPAVKLLPFYQTLKDKAVHFPKARAVQLEVKHSTKRSAALADLEAVNARWMALWMQQWRFD